MTKEDAIESYKRSVELCKVRLDIEKMRMDIGEIKELEFYIERDEMAIKALKEYTEWLPKYEGEWVAERENKTE